MAAKSLHTLDEAVRAIIIRWNGGLGVEYQFSEGDRVTRAIGPEDQLALDRLRRAGRVDYVDDYVRRRYAASLGTGRPKQRIDPK